MNTFRKICLSAMFLLTAAVCHAYDVKVGDIYYNLDKNEMTASVTYKEHKNFGSYDFYSGIITIPESITFSGTVYSVTEIGTGAFEDCTSLTAITIPNSVEVIEYGAFARCSDLTSVIVGKSVKNIGNRAFVDCTSLTSITIPNSVEYVGEEVFMYCEKLASVIIGNGVKYIGSDAFYDTPFFKSLPDGSIYINNLFYKYKGTMPNNFHVDIKEGTTSILPDAFAGCSALESISIPSSVTYIGTGAFNGCYNLKKLIIADGSETLALEYNNNNLAKGKKGLFYDCPLEILYLGRNLSYNADSNFGYSPFHLKNKTLISVTVGNDVTSIGEHEFFSCTKSESSITLGDNITSIGSDAFSFCPAKLYVNKGTYTLLSLWAAKIEPYSIGTNKHLTKPYFTVTTTQTTAKIKLENTEEYTDFVFYKGGEILENKEWAITGLVPDYRGTVYVTIYKSANDNTVSCRIEKEYCTNTIGPYLDYSSTASSIYVTGRFYKGDAEVVGQGITFDKKRYPEENTVKVTGLNPNSSYTITYYITLKNGKTYSKEQIVTTRALKLETQQPKVINTGNVIVKAKANLNYAETNVGFEWRRTDWTDDFASNTGGAYLYDGEMEGYIRNLATAYLWKYRAYYVSDGGSHYYGEWVGIDPTNTSYFEPTVHTYDNVSVDGNTAKVRGYAQRGTDNITEQGFVYWKNTAAAAKGNGAKSASSVPGGAQTVTVRVSGSNPVIEATLAGLDYNTDYSYMAFVTTDEGTFYGEEQAFKTGGDPTGILDITAGTPQRSYPAGIYDLNGRKLEKMQRGVNIVRLEDGTVKKIMVK